MTLTCLTLHGKLLPEVTCEKSVTWVHKFLQFRFWLVSYLWFQCKNVTHMRVLMFITISLLTLSCAGPKKTSATAGKLNGTWIPVNEEMGGKQLPKVAFETQKLIIADSNYTFTAESVDKGVVRYKDDKMDIYGKEGVNAGKHFTALYKYENEQLTICYNLKGDHYPESFETTGKPLYFLSVFKKETPK